MLLINKHACFLFLFKQIRVEMYFKTIDLSAVGSLLGVSRFPPPFQYPVASLNCFVNYLHLLAVDVCVNVSIVVRFIYHFIYYERDIVC